MNESTDTRVLLVRHGRTALNAEGRLRGLADPELDEQGIEEARAVAHALRASGIECVASSPLRRAMRTAEIIADACGAPHEVDPAFNDRDYGEWTGHLRSEVIAQWGGVDLAPGVEPSEAVRVRALRGLEAIAGRSRHRVVAVVTHDAVIRPLLETFGPGVGAEVPTASWSELRFHDGSWEVLSVDNVA